MKSKFNNLQDTINFIENSKRMHPETSRMRMIHALKDAGYDVNKLKVVHITGTNGKGSTSTYIANILKAAGNKVGLFTSPYVNKFNERIKLNNLDISDSDLMYYTNKFYNLYIQYEMGFFEILTFIATAYYIDQQVEYAVMEVGIGGRFDATNIFHNKVSVITNVTLDHTDTLGKTVYDILNEKKEIIKDHEPCVTSIDDQVMLDTISQKTNNLIVVEGCEKIEGSFLTNQFIYKNKTYEIQMLGDHQILNASMAIEVANILGINIEHIKSGLFETIVPGRIEILSKNPYIVVDGAHNSDSMLNLYATIKNVFKGYHKVLVFGNLSRKELDYKDLIRGYNQVIFTKFNDPGCSDPYELQNSVQHPNSSVIEDFDAIMEVIENSTEKTVFIFAGSFRLVTSVRSKIIAYLK